MSSRSHRPPARRLAALAGMVLAVAFPAAKTRAQPANEAKHQEEALRYWPQWRGPRATGAAVYAEPPLQWSEEKNVRWKSPLPGRGHSTPIVWGDHIFLTASVPFGEKLEPRFSGAAGAHDNLPVSQRHKYVVLCVNRGDGQIAWQRIVREALPHEGGHYTASLASHSPVADGEHVVAFFGSQGLYCLDHDGKLVWKKDFGRMQTKHGHGEGSSPLLYRDTLVVNWDHEGESFVAAFDKRTGRELWKVARDEVTSWATPIVVEAGRGGAPAADGGHDDDRDERPDGGTDERTTVPPDERAGERPDERSGNRTDDVIGRPQVIVSGTSRVRSYDLATGRINWECGGLSANIVASPVAADGMVFAASSYDTQALLAIRVAGSAGDITGSKQVVWQRHRGTPYVPSPLLYRGWLYFLRHYQGILSRVEAATGREEQGPFRLPGIGNVYASPVAADGRIYITDRDGTTLVISHDEPRPLALNRLNDTFNASAALSGGDLFLRGERYLYRITEER